MRHARLKEITVRSSALTKIVGSGTRRSALIIAVLMGSVLLVAAVRAYNRVTPNGVNVTKSSAPSPLVQAIGKPSGKLYTRLSFQPEADKLRRWLGQRFTRPGRERATLVGTLTIGAQQLPVRIIRAQNDDGEQVEIALGPGGASLTWSAVDGAKSGASLANGIERQLIERLALDSPDQFVLAQLRGASYYTIAQSARPSEAGDSDSYAGPVWDLIRIVEPQTKTVNKPESIWRIYYINNSTGLIDKILYQEQGETTTAELLGWASNGGEVEPSLIRWTRTGSVLMELRLDSVSHGPK